jgi:hypothetical protein
MATTPNAAVVLNGPLQNNRGGQAVCDCSFAIAASTANISLVTIQLATGDGATAVGQAKMVDLVLSDSATGDGLTATTASGAVTATTGVVISTYTAKKALRVQADKTGKIVLSITDTAKTGFYVAVDGGAFGPMVSRQLVAADYG